MIGIQRVGLFVTCSLNLHYDYSNCTQAQPSLSALLCFVHFSLLENSNIFN